MSARSPRFSRLSRSGSFTSFAALLAVGAVLVATNVGCVAAVAEKPEPTACPAAANEPNESEDATDDLGELTDDPNSGKSIASSVHTTRDQDWYRVHISDRGLGGDPEIHAFVSPGFQVTTWFVCDGGHTTSSVCLDDGRSDYRRVDSVEGCLGQDMPAETSADGTTIGSSPGVMASSTTDCSGTSDDDGTLFIRVERTSSAGSECTYDLTIEVE